MPAFLVGVEPRPGGRRSEQVVDGGGRREVVTVSGLEDDTRLRHDLEQPQRVHGLVGRERRSGEEVASATPRTRSPLPGVVCRPVRLPGAREVDEVHRRVEQPLDMTVETHLTSHPSLRSLVTTKV